MRQSWHREDIKAAVRKRGGTLRGLALENSLSPTTMSRSFRVRMPTYNGVVSEFLGLSVAELWPHWYSADGKPIGRSRPDAITTRAGGRIVGARGRS